MNEAIRMQISAYVDGELPDNEAELLVRRMSQDADLRAEVAEYLALGRLIRSEPGLAGADRLHQRIVAEIDDRPLDAVSSEAAASKSGALRPLVGIAIAASVALVALFALQQTNVVDDAMPQNPVAAEVVSPVVPSVDAQQERQREYFLKHAESSSERGANGMNSRVVTLRFSEDVVAEDATDEDLAVDEVLDDEATAQP